jgi:GNAT superfamily N-acetyltransferase
LLPKIQNKSFQEKIWIFQVIIFDKTDIEIVWGTPFQYIEDYLTYRTLIRNNSKFCDPSVYKCWYLVDNFVTDDYEGKIEKIFASCETFQMTSIFHQEQGSTYAFASVFVDENHRGKGYGNQLLQQVILKLKQEDSSCQAFILFSDIGPSMYMKIGFKPIKSFEWKFKSMELNVEVDILTKDEVKKLLPSILEVKDEEFSIVFSFEQLQWHWEQECAAFKVIIIMNYIIYLIY